MVNTSIDCVTETIIHFLEGIGIPVTIRSLTTDCFMPGISIESGGILIDPEKLLYPGDILHEAGHLAVMPPGDRSKANGPIDPVEDLKMAGELMAIPWSYAACIHLSLDPAIVFHENGYKGGSQNIIRNFSEGRYFGLPMLQWIGLTYEPKKSKELHLPGFPAMIKWLREEEINAPL